MDTWTHLDPSPYLDLYTDVTSPVKRLTRAERQAQTRGALLDAAIELFIERGTDATSIEDVVGRAGFTRGAFYSNFSSKDELFLDASRRFLEQLHAAARGAGTVEPEGGEAMRARFVRLRSVTRDAGSVFLAEMVLYALRHPELVEPVAELRQWQLPPAEAFARGNLANAGIADVDDAFVTQLANITQALTFGLHFIELVDKTIGAEEAAATAMRLIMRGLVAERAER